MAKSEEKGKGGARTVATNRKARFEYYIEESFEARIVLTGTEIKSLRAGKASIQEGFVLVKDGEAYLNNVHIAQYLEGNRNNHPEVHPRKLLLHKQQIRQLHAQATQRNWTIVPLRVYINERGKAKVEIALVRGKQLHDKRHSIAERDNERDLKRALKGEY